MKKIILSTTLIFGLGVSLFAQTGTQRGSMADVASLESRSAVNSLGVTPVLNPFSLIDFSRIKWSHSYSVNFFSGGIGSGSVGMLNTTMFYDISNSLSLSVNLGIAHDVGGNFRSRVGGNSASFLPGLNLDYHPSENFRMSFSFQRYQGYQGYDGYGLPGLNRGYRSRFLR